MLRVQRNLLGVLFAALAAGLGLIAVYSALAGGGAWVIALAAAALALWMADLARRALVRRRISGVRARRKSPCSERSRG